MSVNRFGQKKWPVGTGQCPIRQLGTWVGGELFPVLKISSILVENFNKIEKNVVLL